VAHSAGTRLAIGFAARSPDRPAALALATPPAEYLVDVPSDVPALVAIRAGEPAVAAAVAALEAGPDLTDDDPFTAWRLRTAPLGYARRDATTRAHARGMRHRLAAARAFMTGETPADLRERLRLVTAPTLVVAGAQDASAGVAPVLGVAGLFSRGGSAVVEGSGHFPWVERPAAFRAVVDPLLARTLHAPDSPERGSARVRTAACRPGRLVVTRSSRVVGRARVVVVAGPAAGWCG
jgi:pimeloyl-ACP methyl ester carboxylesterase